MLIFDDKTKVMRDFCLQNLANNLHLAKAKNKKTPSHRFPPLSAMRTGIRQNGQKNNQPIPRVISKTADFGVSYASGSRQGIT
jgi:hypothetical protein